MSETPLQEEFLHIVERMRETKVQLPEEFALFYRVMIQKDRKGTAVSIRPFLTQEQADNSLGEDEQWEGKYGRSVSWEVCDAYNRVSLENVLATDEDFDGNTPRWTKHDAEFFVQDYF